MNSKKKLYGILGGIFLILACIAVIAFAVTSRPAKATAEMTEFAPEQTDSTDGVELVGFEEELPTTSETPQESVSAQDSDPVDENPTGEYISPIDFPSLRTANEEIAAWLDIPGTEISYPILQSAVENGYYLNHDAEKNESAAGALFIDDYNQPDFSDLCCIIYGHHMRSGAFFGNLQQIYSDETSFEEHCEAVVYLPEGERHYTVVCAVPYNDDHILYYNDFTDQTVYRAFMNELLETRELGSNFNSSYEIDPNQRLLILSTCLSGNSSRRYLVVYAETSVLGMTTE